MPDVPQHDISTFRTDRPGPSAGLPDQIGHYRIIRRIGQGAMGSVFEAEQEKPKRTVALKVINAGVASAQMLRRFELEAQVLGRLQHPGIAQIYEADTFDAGQGAQPFFAMELIHGRSLTEYATATNLGTRQRLELMTKICDAVHHAHQRGVIHRDLKPGNILVDESGQPKILDFGVARATDSDIQTTSLRTDIGQLIGTIPYMSPEQAAGDPNELDTRSDVYALGVVCYELLADRLPYDLTDKMIPEAVRVIRDEDPTPLSSVNKVFRGDVETIIAKALEKEKARRYQSAAQFASDIQHYLDDEPIVARPASTWYQLRKFTRRNKPLVVGVAATFLALTGGLIGTITFALGEAEQRAIAEQREKDANAAKSLAQQREQEADEAREREAQAKEQAQARADELEIVTAFQQSMLSEIDAEQMGRNILEDLRAEIEAALGEQGPDQSAKQAVLASFDQAVARANTTNLALEVIDRNILARAAATIKKEFAEQPSVRASLQQTVADTYREIGLNEPATPLQEAALQTRREVLGNDHPNTLISINNMGVLLRSQGKLAEAEHYYREALEVQRRVLGDDHPNTLTSIINMGLLLRSQGKLAEAEPYLREALEGHRRVLGDDHPDTLASINNMGSLLRSQGKLTEAEPYHGEALEGNRRVLGDDHSGTLISKSNLALLLVDLGNAVEAEELAGEAVVAARETLGAEHWFYGNFLGKHGRALAALERFDDAESALLEAHGILQTAVGDEHLQTKRVVGYLADLYDAWHEAEPGRGYDAKAAEWRAKLAEEGTEASRDEGTKEKESDE